MVDRDAFFSRIKLSLIQLLKLVLDSYYSTALLYTLVTFIGLSAIKSVLMTYLDLLVDVNIYASLRHIMHYIVVDEDKYDRISRLPLSDMSHLYVGCGIISHVAFYVIYLNYLKRCFALAQSWHRKVLLIPSILFPVHFTLLNVAKYSISWLTLKNNLRHRLNQMVEAAADNEALSAEYLEYRKRIKKTSQELMEVHQTLVMFLICESLAENLPQLAMTTALLVNELVQQHGKLLTILSNIMIEYIGGNYSVVCTLIAILQTNKMTFVLAMIHNSWQYPLGNGISGAIIQFATIAIMVGSKIVLYSIVFSNALTLLPIVLVLELGVVIIYCKILQIKATWMDTILPGVILSCLLKFRGKSGWLKVSNKTLEVISAVSIPILNLVFVYFPVYLIIEKTNYLYHYKSFYSPQMHGITVAVYIGVVLTYVPLCLLFRRYGDPWRHLKRTTSIANKSENIKSPEDSSLEMEDIVVLLPSELKQLQKIKKDLKN